MKNRAGLQVSGFGMQVLKKMATGKILAKGRDKDFKIGALSVPLSLINEFKKIDLIEEAHPSPNIKGLGYGLSSVGDNFLRRHACTGKPKPFRNKKAKLTLMGADPEDNSFKVQHQRLTRELIKEAGERKLARINRAESPIGWLANRRDQTGKPFLTQLHIDVAERFRADFEMSGLNPKVTGGYEGVPITRSSRRTANDMTPMEHQIQAKKRYSKAIEALGPGLSDVLVRVCCYLEGLGQTEANLGWPNRSAKLVLKLALDRLILHYQNH